MDKNCQNCGIGFDTKNDQHKYCSSNCRVDAFHKRKTGVITGVSTPVSQSVQYSGNRGSNVIYLTLEEYDELKDQVLLNQESWNQEIQKHKDTMTWMEFYQSQYHKSLQEEKKLLGIITDLQIRVNSLTEECSQMSPIVEKTLGTLISKL